MAKEPSFNFGANAPPRRSDKPKATKPRKAVTAKRGPGDRREGTVVLTSGTGDYSVDWGRRVTGDSKQYR